MDDTFMNHPIAAISSLISVVVASASEAELAAVFYSAKSALPLRYTCIEMGCKQPSEGSFLSTDNKTAESIVNNKCKIKRSKSMDMRWFWIRQRCLEFKEFNITWRPGLSDIQLFPDFLTKPYPKKHTMLMRNRMLKPAQPLFDTARSRRSTKRNTAAAS
jgi:hypothetical protein